VHRCGAVFYEEAIFTLARELNPWVWGTRLPVTPLRPPLTAVMAQGVPSLSQDHRISAPPIHIVKYNVYNIMDTHVFLYPALFFVTPLPQIQIEHI
jgi:hypothetical protein